MNTATHPQSQSDGQTLSDEVLECFDLLGRLERRIPGSEPNEGRGHVASRLDCAVRMLDDCESYLRSATYLGNGIPLLAKITELRNELDHLESQVLGRWGLKSLLGRQENLTPETAEAFQNLGTHLGELLTDVFASTLDLFQLDEHKQPFVETAAVLLRELQYDWRAPLSRQ